MLKYLIKKPATPVEDTTEVEDVNGEVSNEGSSNAPTPVQTPERNRSEKRNAEVK